MKIALITTDSREHYKDYGNAVPSFGAAPEALLEGFARLPGIEVHVLSCARARMPAPAKIGPNLFFHGLYVPRLGWTRTAYQGCIRAIRRKLREIQPDIVHGQGTERECAICAIYSGFPNVVTIHGNMAELARQFRQGPGSYLWLAGLFETFTLKRTLGVFCNSAYTEGLVRPRARRTWRVPNPLREMFLAAPAHASKPARCTLINIGEVSERKRQMEVLAVAEDLRRQGLDFQLRFLGDAPPHKPYVADFLARLKPLESAGFARCLGLKYGNELLNLLDESTGMIHFSPAESFGLAVAEGLARNLKLFAARVGGVPDIAGGAPGAELFEMNDWRGLTAAVAAWIRQGFPRAQGAAELMRSRYEPEAIARRHIEIYREVLKA